MSKISLSFLFINVLLFHPLFPLRLRFFESGPFVSRLENRAYFPIHYLSSFLSLLFRNRLRNSARTHRRISSLSLFLSFSSTRLKNALELSNTFSQDSRISRAPLPSFHGDTLSRGNFNALILALENDSKVNRKNLTRLYFELSSRAQGFPLFPRAIKRPGV